jgi:hypothetical protein
MKDKAKARVERALRGEQVRLTTRELAEYINENGVSIYAKVEEVRSRRSEWGARGSLRTTEGKGTGTKITIWPMEGWRSRPIEYLDTTEGLRTVARFGYSLTQVRPCRGPLLSVPQDQ